MRYARLSVLQITVIVSLVSKLNVVGSFFFFYRFVARFMIESCYLGPFPKIFVLFLPCLRISIKSADTSSFLHAH